SREEARMELSMAASAAERANQPRWIVYLGVLLLIASCIFALWAWSQRSTALAQAERERLKTKRLVDLRNQLEVESSKLASRATIPDPRTGQHIEQLASTAGISTPPTVTDQLLGGASVGGMVQRKYTARLNSEDPLNVLNWLASTQTSPLTPGLEITRLVLRPGTPIPTRPVVPNPGTPGVANTINVPGSGVGTVVGGGAGGGGGGGVSGGWYTEVEFTRWEKTK
ncbi:MAG: hypothetical protein K2W85_01635, partial [Phycisphaerales bacterium]|nr:hypothetical protein [Phycisphaerales bacterium]